MRGSLSVIRSELREWKGGNITRYYFNRWDRFFHNGELDRYRDSYGLDATDFETGIRVYFDDQGVLHVDNCEDPAIKDTIERKMYGWYKAKELDYEMAHQEDLQILDIIRPYLSEIKPGYYRVRYNGLVFNFDHTYMAHLQWSGKLYSEFRNEEFHIHTGYPRFDQILNAILEERKKRADLLDLGFISDP